MIEYENREVINEFLEETLSGFDTIENAMLDLEKDPQNVDIINIIFRPIHSLKGNSAYFGLMKVKQLTHNMENLLDFARRGKILITSKIINHLLAGIDFLREMIQRVEQEQEQVGDEDKYNYLLELFDKIVAEYERPYTISETEKNQLVDFFHNVKDKCTPEVRDNVHNLLSIFTKDKMEKEESKKSFDKIILLKELLKKPFADFEANETEIAELKLQLDGIGEYCTDIDSQNFFRELLETFDSFAYSGIGIDDVGQEIITDKIVELENILQNIKTEITAPQKQEEKAEQVQAKEEKSAKSNLEHSTIRINEQSLDEFLGYVAELLSIEELFGYVSRDLGNYDLNLSSSFKRNLEDFSRISSNLRNGIMEIRKVKASNLLQKTQRIVRDIAGKSNKLIKVNIFGDDLKIDKSYVELLDAPLVHMVRNAADHGIEPSEDRQKTGKPEEGVIDIRLFEDDKNLVLEISDDGKGLDLEKLKQKAIEKGLISEKQELEERDIVELLFQSGVSTAEVVTDVSGRGVGMDVVKTAIESANGKISVQSERFKGSTFSVVLPRNVSTQINDVYMVKSFTDEIYALPLKLVEEAFTVDGKEIFSIQDNGNVIKRRGKLLSVFVLDEILEGRKKRLDTTCKDQENVPFLYYNIPGNPLAICVKEVVGVQTIVIKEIDNLQIGSKIFDGAATLGDGKIALKINPDWLSGFVRNGK